MVFTHEIVGWTSDKAGVDTLEKINIFRPCQEQKQNSADHPVHIFRRNVCEPILKVTLIYKTLTPFLRNILLAFVIGN
jgi:hypothetical protein